MSEKGPAAGDLYSGTAGIGLFLAELARHTEDAAVADTAGGALRHALAWAAGSPPVASGLFEGRLGAAYAAARGGALLGRADLTDGARALVRATAASPPPQAYDVMAGAAGAVLALLALRQVLGPEETDGPAGALGATLIERAVPEPWGWSWDAGGERYLRNLLGYGHGASGVAHALAELFRCTGETSFRYAAEQAMLYERRFLSPAGNWPDFRHPATPGAGPGPGYALRYTCAWCHGAAGIALARARASRVLGSRAAREDLRAALSAVRARVDEPEGSFSLCHGIAGAAEALLEAAEALGEPELRALAALAGERGWQRYGERDGAWPPGTRSGAYSPSLMVGEAGVGHFYLRLHDPSVPSVVLLRATGPESGGTAAARETAGPLRARAIDDYFASTRAAVRLLAGPECPCPAEDDAAPDVHRAYLALRDLTEAGEAPLPRRLLADAFAVERERYEMTLGVIDRGEEGWEGPPPGEGGAEPGEGWFRMVEHVRLVVTEYDWDAWTAAREGSRGVGLPPGGPVAHLLVRADNAVRRHRLAPFAAAVVEALPLPRTLAEVTAEVASAFPAGSAPPEPALRARVLAQLGALQRLGAVVEDPVSPLERQLDRLAAALSGTLAVPVAVRMRWQIAKRAETARRHVEHPDRAKALLAAGMIPAELGRLLEAIHAGPLFAGLLRRCAAATGPEDRLSPARDLLDALDRSFAADSLLVEA